MPGVLVSWSIVLQLLPRCVPWSLTHPPLSLATIWHSTLADPEGACNAHFHPVRMPPMHEHRVGGFCFGRDTMYHLSFSSMLLKAGKQLCWHCNTAMYPTDRHSCLVHCTRFRPRFNHTEENTVVCIAWCLQMHPSIVSISLLSISLFSRSV